MVDGWAVGGSAADLAGLIGSSGARKTRATIARRRPSGENRPSSGGKGSQPQPGEAAWSQEMGYFDGYVVVYDPVTYFIANMPDL